MTQLTWYIARSSGIVGWALLSASVLWGLALSTKALGKRPRPNWLLDLHRFLGGAAVVFTIIHVASLLVDSYTDISLTNVLVPLTGTWHPVAVAWGVVGVYLLAAVEVTSLM
ncbi:MAG: ferredoxin-NADPH reductase, partial [Acidimicrobiia bacterium]